ncbi:hypothetical protein CFC21_039424 [Triticum aestivum]|uniref:Uncharacterized protein n=2 Tax=Triticum aestivum TaxID=4565 RepID=A0A9R1FEL8_WHEAT|nr:hypothetical protein CFC21_039424 [Triticum aestivum]CDM80890.1 unnamed protein product [Triticum aestivum]
MRRMSSSAVQSRTGASKGVAGASAGLRSSILGSFGFAIIDISYEENSLRVVDRRLPELLQASNSCRVTILNTSVKVAQPLSIDHVGLNLILYNCMAVAYDATGNYGGYALEGCNAVVTPVLGSSSGQTNASDYKQLINDGFLLTWDPLPLAEPVHISSSVQAQAACEPERCGNLTVSSPFGIALGSEENRCAQLGFQLAQGPWLSRMGLLLSFLNEPLPSPDRHNPGDRSIYRSSRDDAVAARRRRLAALFPLIASFPARRHNP